MHKYIHQRMDVQYLHLSTEKLLENNYETLFGNIPNFEKNDNVLILGEIYKMA